MIFNSLTFLVFFALVLGLHSLPISWRARKTNLLLSSYLFYAAWNPPFVALLWLSTLVDWFAARGMAAARRDSARKSLLVLSLCTNLGLLAVFKYGGFLLESFTGLLAWLGIAYAPPAMSIILPVGISFYTFQTLSYTIDVYRGRLRPAASFIDFALYVSFFPQLVAGPIVRARDFLPQCIRPRRASARQLGWGLSLLILGLFKKVVLADTAFAPVADKVFGNVGGANGLDAWLGVLAFSGQIFCDFAGYSLCAIGVALCLGFSLPDNFRFPYAAIGFSDFWRRWHISLSTWLRDYLYISLGGNRGGRLLTTRNLALTMLLGGLWHGASWRFVAWGGLHGLYLVGERLLRRALGDRLPLSSWPARVLAALATYALVLITWVFFRAEDFRSAFILLRTMFAGTGQPSLLPAIDVGLVALLSAGLLGWHWFMRERSYEDLFAPLPWWTRALIPAALLFLLTLAPGGDRVFIYFQF